MPTNVWNRTVELADVWRDEELSFEEKLEVIVERIRKSGWRDITPYPDTFDDLIADLENTLENTLEVEEFDAVWDEVCDLADEDRVRIETR